MIQQWHLLVSILDKHSKWFNGSRYLLSVISVWIGLVGFFIFIFFFSICEVFKFLCVSVFQPKACAQHCSIFLVVNDIFRWVLAEICYVCVESQYIFLVLTEYYSDMLLLNVYFAGPSLSKLKEMSLLRLWSKPLPSVSWGNWHCWSLRSATINAYMFVSCSTANSHLTNRLFQSIHL